MAKNQKKPQQRGASMIEFAIVCPIFLILIFGIIDSVGAFYSNNTMGLAVADTSREAAIAGSSPDADEVIVNLITEAEQKSIGTDVGRIIIYNASTNRNTPSQDCLNGTETSECVIYDEAEFASPSCTIGWCADQRSPDQLIGIWVESEYKSLSGITPINLSWSDRATSIIEPNVG